MGFVVGGGIFSLKEMGKSKKSNTKRVHKDIGKKKKWVCKQRYLKPMNEKKKHQVIRGTAKAFPR